MYARTCVRTCVILRLANANPKARIGGTGQRPLHSPLEACPPILAKTLDKLPRGPQEEEAPKRPQEEDDKSLTKKPRQAFEKSLVHDPGMLAGEAEHHYIESSWVRSSIWTRPSRNFLLTDSSKPDAQHSDRPWGQDE